MGEQSMGEAAAKADPGDGWLRDENPDVFYLLRAIEGDDQAFAWLERKSAALHLFTRALTGDRRALKAFEAGEVVELDDLFATVGTCDLDPWLRDRRPELCLVFEAIKGDDAEAIKSKTNALQQVSMKLGEAMYKQQAEQAAGGQDGSGEGAGTSQKEDVVDAEFTEVDDDKKNKKSA